MKIIVTGGAGFIGGHIASAFIEAGHSVVVVDNLSTGFKSNVPSLATFYEADITDNQALKHIFAQEKPEIICHQAAQIDVRKSVEDPGLDAITNIVGSVNLLELSIKHGVRKVLFASSGGAGYGEQDYFPADETHPIRPLSPYGITKVTVERYLYYYQQVHGLNYVSLRYANVYGPRQNPHGEAGVIAIFAQRMLAGNQPVINGDGLQTRDYVHVADVVKANVLALEYPHSGCFNVGTGVETTVVTLFDHINAGLGSKFERKHGAAKAGEQRRSVLDCRAIQQAMGWKPTFDLQTGLVDTLAWFKAAYSKSV